MFDATFYEMYNSSTIQVKSIHQLLPAEAKLT